MVGAAAGLLELPSPPQALSAQESASAAARSIGRHGKDEDKDKKRCSRDEVMIGFRFLQGLSVDSGLPDP